MGGPSFLLACAKRRTGMVREECQHLGIASSRVVENAYSHRIQTSNELTRETFVSCALELPVWMSEQPNVP